MDSGGRDNEGDGITIVGFEGEGYTFASVVEVGIKR